MLSFLGTHNEGLIGHVVALAASRPCEAIKRSINLHWQRVNLFGWDQSIEFPKNCRGSPNYLVTKNWLIIALNLSMTVLFDANTGSSLTYQVTNMFGLLKTHWALPTSLNLNLLNFVDIVWYHIFAVSMNPYPLRFNQNTVSLSQLLLCGCLGTLIYTEHSNFLLNNAFWKSKCLAANFLCLGMLDNSLTLLKSTTENTIIILVTFFVSTYNKTCATSHHNTRIIPFTLKDELWMQYLLVVWPVNRIPTVHNLECSKFQMHGISPCSYFFAVRSLIYCRLVNISRTS